MDTAAERLEYYKRQKGLTYSDLAKPLGITSDAIRVAMNRDKVKEVYINIISEKFGVSKEWIVFGVGEMEKIVTKEAPEKIEISEDKEEIIAHQKALLKMVNNLIEKFESYSSPGINDLKELEESIQLKKKIQADLDSLK